MMRKTDNFENLLHSVRTDGTDQGFMTAQGVLTMPKLKKQVVTTMTRLITALFG
jgi:hypothetical protein